jgi:hypothetical protein
VDRAALHAGPCRRLEQRVKHERLAREVPGMAMALRACLDRAKFRLGAARKCTGLLQPMPLPSTAIPGSGGALAAADTAPTMNRRHVMPTPLSSTAVALNSPARCRFYGQGRRRRFLVYNPTWLRYSPVALSRQRKKLARRGKNNSAGPACQWEEGVDGGALPSILAEAMNRAK